eukprot:c40335_g1_i1 orf=14-1786(-)
MGCLCSLVIMKIFFTSSQKFRINVLMFAVLAINIMLMNVHDISDCIKLVKGDSLDALDAWEVKVVNAGVSAMHLAIMRSGKALIFDRTDYGPSAIRLPNGRCRNDSNDKALKLDCWAHSVELNLTTFSVRPLEILSDTWCSSGAFTSDGTLLQTGGYNDGARVVRQFSPCTHAAENISNETVCDWVELPTALSVSRWYASDQILPDNRVIIVGGRRAFSYEFFPQMSTSVNDVPGAVSLPFLIETNDLTAENNLYPFLHLSTDGNLFMFANRDAILLDYKTGAVARRFPTMPGGSRSYPSSGSSVMLPLTYIDRFVAAEVMVCGGAVQGAFEKANKGVYIEADNTCGRISLVDPNSTWVMEEMPRGRVMGDMILLPTQEILIINGAHNGTAGWGSARNPSYSPFLYKPFVNSAHRFDTLSPSTIPRLYHSTAALLPDGKVLVAGSNPNIGYDFGPTTDAFYPTELRIETYTPYYLHASYDALRPTNVSLSNTTFGYNSTDLVVKFFVMQGVNVSSGPQIVLYSPPFTTHSFSMNQRLLVLEPTNVTTLGKLFYVNVGAPPTPIVAPPGYYLLFVINSHIPSEGSWVQLIT